MSFLSTLGTIAGSFFGPVGAGIGYGLGQAGDTFFNDRQADKNDREARAWQERMYNQQRDDNQRFWYEQQDYNSPANQVARLKEAGINPQLAVGNVQSGQVGSVGSSSPPSTSVSQRQSVLGDINATLDAVLNARTEQQAKEEHVRGLKLDNDAKETDNQTRFLQNLLSLQDVMAGIRHKNSSTRKMNTERIIADLMAAPNFIEKMANIEKIYAETNHRIYETARGWTELSYLPVDKRIQYLDTLASIEERYAKKELTKQQVKTEIHKTNNEYYKSKGQKIQNEMNERCMDAIVEKAIQETIPAIGRYGENTGDWTNSRKYGQYK